MSAPILATKLYIPPPRPNLVPRPRLTELLKQGRDRKLTLVSAPAGFGKTTVVADWLSRHNLPAAWLSLDQGDNDSARFMSYLIAALQQLESELGQATQSLLQAGQNTPLEAVMTSLINEIAKISTKITVVLDDYHLIETPAIDQALTFLLEHLPPQLHLVIISRADPSLPLPRLRVRGQLTELRADDLRFTTEEAAAFLTQVTGLTFTPENVLALENRTEGWIAGLQLAALSINETTNISNFIDAFTGSHRYIIDYLADEVLDQQPETVRQFLLKTSILRRLCGPLCDAIVGAESLAESSNQENQGESQFSPAPLLPGAPASSQQLLEYLEQANLFVVPLDSDRRWYRYHHLFADLLQQRLKQTLSKNGSSLSELHHRAGQWYETQATETKKVQLIEDALYHALAAKDFERASRLIEQHAAFFIMRGEVATVKDWLEALPVEVIRANPRLCSGQAWIYFFTQELEAIEPLLQLAEEKINAGDAADPDKKLGALGEIASLRTWVARDRGDTEQAIQLARQALDYLPQDRLFERGMNTFFLASALKDQGDTAQAVQTLSESIPLSYAAGNILAAMGATAELANLQIVQGQLHQAKATLQQAISEAVENNRQRLPAAAQLHAVLALVLYEQNRLEQTEEHLKTTLELAGHGLIVLPIAGVSQITLARLKQIQGDEKGMVEALENFEHAMQSWTSSQYVADLAARRVRVLLARGDLTTANRWQQEAGLNPADAPTARREFEFITLAQLLLARVQLHPADNSDAQAALHLLRQIQQTAAAAGRMGRVIEILALQAVACVRLGRAQEATSVLEQALTLAEPQGYVRTFVDQGPVMAALLQKIATQSSHADYIRELLATFPAAQLGTVALQSSSLTQDGKSQTPVGDPAALPDLALVEPLSDRELEVLRLVAGGLSNRDIAEQLFLATSTVKRHISNIYGKLGVNSRTQAIGKAQALQLI